MIAHIWFGNALLIAGLIIQVTTWTVKRDSSFWRAIDFAGMIMIIAAVYYLLAVFMRV